MLAEEKGRFGMSECMVQTCTKQL